MLRFAVISAATLSVLGLAFYFVVLHAQPPAVTSGGGAIPVVATTVPSTQASSSMVGPGYKPWFVNLENGKVVSKFTAVEFTPQKDQSFLVDHPVSIFYLDKGQYMKVTGESGLVNCDTAAPKTSGGAGASGGLFSAPTSSPKNGSLHHVRVELFPSESATRATQWMETENIHFDNETLPTMYTQSYIDPQGNTIAADQVPVTVRGDEYEFDGNGLTLVWDAQKRLEKLEIYHGGRLEIINPSKLSMPGTTPTAEALPRNTGFQPVLGAVESVRKSPTNDTASTGRRPVLRESGVLIAYTQTAAAPLKPVESTLPYLAVFHDQVKVDEAARTMAIADLMTVDFLQGNGKPKSTSAAASVVPPPTPAPATSVPLPVPAPAKKPANGPVTIYWSGPLVVTPLKGPPMMPLSAGQSIIRLVGSPVKLTPEGSEVTAASATYRSPDGAVQLGHSADVPLVHLRQDKGLMLSTGAIDYDPATGYAILSGPSALSLPVDKKQMNVSWSQQGVLHVVRASGQPNGVDHVDLVGDVAVTHPLFGLNSHELQLELNLVPKPGSTDADEQLRLMTAIDNVTCQLTHPGKPKQQIDADLLKIRTEPTADKHGVFPREVVADGRVHAFDPDQSITAGHLDALLLAKAGPATNPSADDVNQAVDLESLYASGDVHARMKNNGKADADQLRVTTVDGVQKVDLWGSNGAKLNDGKGSRLSGGIVHLVPNRSGVSVEGPGSMETIRAVSTTRSATAAPPPPPRPIDISWTDSMSLDAAANIADVLGHVTVKNVDNIGTLSTITGDTAHLDLVDMPKNTKKLDGAAPATQPDAMGGKQLKVLTLSGNVVGSSELNDAAGTPLRRGNLYGEKLIYTVANGTAIIPGPGRLFVENHKQDAKDAASLGAMAVKWSKQLTYNQNTDQITIDGDTRVGFEQEKIGQRPSNPVRPQVPMQLDSQQLVIDLAKATPAAGSAAQGKMQLSKMESIGQVHFLANGIELYCDKVDYDPKTATMTATGNPGRAMNAGETASGYFDQLRYDTVKEEVIDGLNIKGKIER